MLENLMNLVKENAGEAIINNPAIPNERNDDVIAESSQSITSGLQGMLAGGGLKDVLQLFSGQANMDQSNPVVQNLSGGLTGNLVNKFGLDQQKAGGIAGSLIPSVLKNLVSKTNDPSDNGFDLQNIFNTLSGGKTQGANIGALVNKFTQGRFDKDGDGDTDLQDVMAMLSGNKENNSGVFDTVKGLFN